LTSDAAEKSDEQFAERSSLVQASELASSFQLQGSRSSPRQL